MRRLKIWNWILIRMEPDQVSVLPLCLSLIYALLFPLKALFWRVGKAEGYQAEKDIWNIYGVKYSGALFRNLAVGNNECFMVVRQGDDVIGIQRLKGNHFSNKEKPKAPNRSL